MHIDTLTVKDPSADILSLPFFQQKCGITTTPQKKTVPYPLYKAETIET